ncbi:MAG: hypothetical protein AB8B64_21470 [Granulosicoccus sp.]
MKPLSTGELERLIEIMRDMYDFAMTSNWQELTRLDSERRVLLSYDSPVASPDTKYQHANHLTTAAMEHLHHKEAYDTAPDSRSEGLISEIRHLDSQIVQTVLTQRKQLLKETRGLSAQMKVKNIYAQTSVIT